MATQKKYHFARAYLTGLLICAIFILIVGILTFCGFSFASLSDWKKASNLESGEINIDTEHVGLLLDTAIEQVSKVSGVPKTQIEASKPPTTGLIISTSATLPTQKRKAFEEYLTQNETFIAQLKNLYVIDCAKAINALGQNAKAALQKINPSAKSTFNESYPVEWHTTQTKLSQNNFNKFNTSSLYIKSFFDEESVLSLNGTANFLMHGVKNYTDSKQTQSLASKAGEQVRRMITVLGVNTNYQDDKNTSSDKNAENQEALILSYMGKLNYCLDVISNVALSNWAVDQEIRRVKEEIVSKERAAKQRAAEVMLSAKVQFFLALKVLFGALIAAFLLLVIREFLSAIIDIACNTEATAVNTKDARDLLKRMTP